MDNRESLYFKPCILFGAPQKHRVLEHRQPKHQLLKHQVSKTSTVNNIDCLFHRVSIKINIYHQQPRMLNIFLLSVILKLNYEIRKNDKDTDRRKD